MTVVELVAEVLTNYVNEVWNDDECIGKSGDDRGVRDV